MLLVFSFTSFDGDLTADIERDGMGIRSKALRGGSPVLMLSTMSAAMRSALEGGVSPAMFRKVREHLVLLCEFYMLASEDHPPSARIE